MSNRSGIRMKRKVLKSAALLVFTTMLLFISILPGYTSELSTKAEVLPEKLLKAEQLQQFGLDLPAVAKTARANGKEPGAFQNVTYAFKPNVEVLSGENLSALKTNLKEGKISKGKLKAQPDTGKIYIDPETRIPIQFLEDGKNKNYYVTMPEFQDVLEDFNIPEQSVALNTANISFLSNSAVQVTDGKMQTPKPPAVPGVPTTQSVSVTADGILISFEGKDAIHLSGTSEDGSTSYNFNLEGSIRLIAPHITGYYSFNSGYKFVFKAGEEIDLRLSAGVKLNKTVKIPICGFDIDAGLGSATLGLFLRVDVNGEMQLGIDIDQGFVVEAGVKGGTFWGFPTSIKGVLEKKQWCKVSKSFNASVKGFVGLSAEAKLELLGYNMLKTEIRMGPEMQVETDGAYLNGECGLRLVVSAKVLGYKKTFVNEYWKLFAVDGQDTGGYILSFEDADAWLNQVRIRLQKENGKREKDDYTGVAVLKVIRNKQETIYRLDGKQSGKTPQGYYTAGGYFTFENVDLVKGDKIQIQIPGKEQYFSDKFDPSFHFNTVQILTADYFTGVVEGDINRYMKTDGGAVTAIPNSPDLVSYDGPVEIVIERDENVTIPAFAPGGTAFITVPVPREIIYTVNAVRGQFSFSSEDIKPGDRIEARMAYDGVTLASGTIEPEGILMGSIVKQDFTVAREGNGEVYAAEDVELFISSIRGEKAPTGKVELLMGVAWPHREGVFTPVQLDADTSSSNTLKNGLLFVDKSLNLQPTEDPNTSVVQTGSWRVVSRTKPPMLAEKAKLKDQHYFESAEFVFKGQRMGYTSLESACAYCNVVHKMEMMNDMNQRIQDTLNTAHMSFDRQQLASGVGKEPEILNILDALVNPSGMREAEIYLENRRNMTLPLAGEALMDMTLEQIVSPDIYNETAKTAKARQKMNIGR
ncbi:MAG: hypothetical protein KBA53_11980 [Thermoclostridium sp.]|nr:hypothetical protein [Thermoclostridium sp.]